MKYLVVVERGKESYGAYVPNLPGCAVVGKTCEEARQLIGEAIDLHVSSLKENGDPVPEPGN